MLKLNFLFALLQHINLSRRLPYGEIVRNYRKKYSLEKAVERAVTECIQNGILKEFLTKNRAEVGQRRRLEKRIRKGPERRQKGNILSYVKQRKNPGGNKFLYRGISSISPLSAKRTDTKK